MSLSNMLFQAPWFFSFHAATQVRASSPLMGFIPWTPARRNMTAKVCPSPASADDLQQHRRPSR